MSSAPEIPRRTARHVPVHDDRLRRRSPRSGWPSRPRPTSSSCPFSFGLGLMAAIAAFGHISGGHFNPAVTVAMVLDKRTTPVEARRLHRGPDRRRDRRRRGRPHHDQPGRGRGAASPSPAPGISDVSALILETIFTAIFLVVILTTSKRAGSLAGVFIPLTLVAIHFAIATVTRLVGEPGALDRIGARRRRPDRPVDLHRRPDRRRHHRLRGLPPHGADRGASRLADRAAATARPPRDPRG